MEPTEGLDLVLTEDQIVGFSYSFSKALTEFLGERINTQSLYKNSGAEKSAREQPKSTYFPPHPEVSTAIHYLAAQMNSPEGDSFDDISELVSRAERFLAIFKKK